MPVGDKKYRKKPKTLSKKAGLIFNVRRFHRQMKAGKYAKRVGHSETLIYLFIGLST